MAETVTPKARDRGRIALRFVLLIGVLSFFADFTYEGSRSVLGPYLAALGASALIVGLTTGFGELAGYGLRLVSGRWADASGAYWPITIVGYLVQMTAVPMLALTGNWPSAAALIILERVGKAIRNPPRDTMLSYAGKEAGGVGWAFGLHEALDQAGAMVGPLAVAAVLARGGNFHLAFLALAVPAAINLALVALARVLYPRPQDLSAEPPVAGGRLPGVYWIYLAGAGLAALGFADYPLIAYHFARARVVPGPLIAVFYAVAMGVSGAGSLAFGRLFDRFGFKVLIGLTLASALFAPLVFFGGFWVALIGAAVWGLGMGVHESIIPAAVTQMTPGGKRATAFGLFTAGYGVFWFLGSGAIGFLYDRSVMAAVLFCVVAELAAAPFFLWAARSMPPRA
ncbi:MAG: MFS transporter [Caulobacteraceae bacterium]